MSAFLGPIHYWLYNKVQLQEEFIHDILEFAAQKDWSAISADTLDSTCGKIDVLPLEDIIDESNIHGWLHERIAITEARLALLVTELLKEDASRLSDLQELAVSFGKTHAVQNGTGAEEALQTIENTLLDGMPCDHVNQVLASHDDSVLWRKMQCMHCEYWQQVGGDVAVYNSLREHIIKGMLTNSGLAFHALANDEYKICREE